MSPTFTWRDPKASAISYTTASISADVTAGTMGASVTGPPVQP
jgi:hypothetical protein